MKKIIELDDYFPTGEPTVQTVLTWNNGRRVDTSRVTKYASAALDYIKAVAPEPGKTSLLLNALGAEETYGPNRNGDGFPEFPVAARGKVASVDRRWWVPPGEELTAHYASFEKNPAHAFKHHANRDPSKASGVVKKAFWNPRMHRVELLVSVDNDKDPEWIKRANDGEFVPVSMGCRIKRDVCARCGNEAPTRADYCDHVKFAINQVDANGFKDYVHNPSPDFFDISRVFRPADRTGYTLKKVAYAHEVRLSADLGASVENLALKSGASQKLSDIDKVIRAEPLASSTLTPDEQSFIVKFRDHVGPKLAASADIDTRPLHSYPLGDVLRAAASNGVVFKDAEFIVLASTKLAGSALALSPMLVEKIAAAGRWALAMFVDRPELLAEMIDSGVLESTKTADALLPVFGQIREKRAYVGEMLYRRLVPEGTGFRPDGAATTDVLHTPYGNTTRGAAIDAQDAVTRAHIGKVLGGTGLLLGGYKALTAFPWMRKFKVPLAIGAGALGVTTLKSRPGGTMRTDEGYDIPDITELSAKTASREALVHLIECAQNTSRCVDFSGVKVATAVNLDDVAQAIGNIMLT
jgi:hypothetical protein